jgi:SAM-dependent methyltransferase
MSSGESRSEERRREEALAAVQALARRAVEEGRPLAWFEEIYREARAHGGAALIPWAEGEPNPVLTAFAGRLPFLQPRGRALVIGSGLGDDAEWLAAHGWNVTAFDVAPSAVEGCRIRFPHSTVDYRVADLFAPPPGWDGAFDLVVEVYTIQALPPALRAETARRIADFVAPGGHLVLVTRGRLPDEAFDGPPWPLSRDELALFAVDGLQEAAFEESFEDDGEVRRFAVCYRRG